MPRVTSLRGVLSIGLALLATRCVDGPASVTSPEDGATPDGVAIDVVSPDVSAVDVVAVEVRPGDASMRLDVPASTDVSRLDVVSATDVVRRDGPAVDVVAPPCRTRVTYGAAWIHGPGHATDFDDVDGLVAWDGNCTDDGANSYAVLSNGWRPYFAGRGACVIALDATRCASTATTCATRVTYGDAWMHGPDHAAQYDDVDDVVTWDGVCHASGAQSYAVLSNGWRPHFAGTNRCEVSLRHTQCGGLYANPVVDVDCPDPGVVRDGDTYVMVCTSGGAASAFPIRTSTDLVHWTARGAVFPAGRRPAWARGDFWAPEIHRVGDRWVAYYTARGDDGSLAIGAATAASVLGPYTDLGHALVHDPHPGVIDATEYEAPDHARYLLWKTDGNAVGARTPIHIQRLAADGLSLTGAATTLITNDQPWEGGLVEGPWMIDHGGMFYLFYSANGYASTAYAIGVARASSPMGPFVKAPAPILVTKGPWAGPGHGSVVVAPGGAWAHVYHAWVAGHVGDAPGRQVLVDRITWDAGWPQMLGAPSSRSQPPP